MVRIISRFVCIGRAWAMWGENELPDPAQGLLLGLGGRERGRESRERRIPRYVTRE